MVALLASGQGRLSFQVLEEYYVTVTRKLQDVRDLSGWRPTPIDGQVATWFGPAWGRF